MRDFSLRPVFNYITVTLLKGDEEDLLCYLHNTMNSSGEKWLLKRHLDKSFNMDTSKEENEGR